MSQHTIMDVCTPEEYDKHAIIKPPESSEFDNDKKYTRLVVDSTYRDQSQYPNPNDYYFVFDDDITDVASAKLMSMDIPFSTYIINMYFNKLWVSVGTDAEVVVTLPLGNYDTVELAAMMQSALNASIVGATFTVTYNRTLDKYTFSATTAFSLNFAGKTNNLSALLGFDGRNYTSDGTNTIVAPFRCNFEFNKYIVMCIDQFDNNKSNTKPLNKSFAVITQKYFSLNLADEPNIVKNFNPPLGRLLKIHITFFDKYGNLYDFQNMDHRFEILFQSFKQRRKYHNIFGLKNK